ncbi:uncharacterized protein BO97DRAFT_472465 [Aspergillus homomorphus CBS 101889]|uniref:Prion-inhibition and propagation HeLo domain-containing protein n=1 Tax=Aspergillus homomorphus (strain CBS 101889) TaxID=1450537 RepID=A0A395HRF3_ASPHC|nr:hypothetical protein BO97DRAFT_472465 [Aspergillus homomorphus CBS 101889]RAL09428.1 hypothetical protein BO97DRAFT_472465 [Aspergillus homomorphus CBS 101889]
MATQGQLDAVQASDIAQLWSFHLAQFSNIQQIMKGTEGMSNEFKDFRHDRSKTDNVRTALKNNLQLIQKVVNMVEVVGNAASVSSLISTAFGQVMQSFASVSADYDKIMGFFDFTHRFFDRLSMIEDKTPQQAPFQRCVARVFSGMLTIYSVAQEYAEKKRSKKWFSSLVDGSDGALSGAIQEMEEAVNELTQAVGLTTLRTVDILDKIIQSINGNVEFLVAQVTVIDGRMEAIKSDTIIEQTQALDLKQDAMLKMLEEQSPLFKDAVQCFESIQMGSNLGQSIQTSLLKLDVVRLRLTRWGEWVGLSNVADGDAKELQMTKLALEAQDLKVLDPAEELDGVTASLHQKKEDLAKKRQGNSELEQDQVIILYEEKNLARLAEDINGLADGLVDLFPGIQEGQRKLCEEEGSELNANEGALSPLKEVAAGQDKLLSDTVVKAIQPPPPTPTIRNNSGKISGVLFGGS